MAKAVVVVGAVNVDIGGRPNGALRPRDSNPGRVRMSLGGVGRNIAHNMALLGLDVSLLTAFGDDLYAHEIAASCRGLGIDISRALTVPGGASSTYLFLSEENGEMAAAVSDMEIYDRLTPAYLAPQLAFLNAAALVVADANIPGESLQWLAQQLTVPLFVDPVSTAKAKKLLPILGKIHTLKPNRQEAELLSGVPIHGTPDLEAAADALLATGLGRVFISLGPDGVYAADHQAHIHLPNPPAKMVNTTGCGDAFVAALAWSQLQALGLRASAQAGLVAAAVAMAAQETINPALCAACLST